jgi:hypothetical protein
VKCLQNCCASMAPCPLRCGLCFLQGRGSHLGTWPQCTIFSTHADVEQFIDIRMQFYNSVTSGGFLKLILHWLKIVKSV